MRTCVFIWHRVKAVIDCSSGVPVFSSPVAEGSHFPSHRLWLDGAQMHNVPQGPLSGLWDTEPVPTSGAASPPILYSALFCRGRNCSRRKQAACFVATN